MASASASKVGATGAPDEIRIILLGKTGTGKSASGNTVLGSNTFVSRYSPDSVTVNCTFGTREFHGKQLFVVDSPGFLDTNLPEAELYDEIAKSYQMTAVPGPHAFLLVLDPTKRFTPEEYRAIKCLDKIFGAHVVHHTIVIFTRSDSLSQGGTTIEKYLEALKPNHPIKELLAQVGQRYLSVNNMGNSKEKDSKVKSLLDKIAKMIENKNGQVFTNPQFLAVAKAIETEVSQGNYKPVKSDGSYALLPQTKSIIINNYLRRTSDRKAN